MAFEIVFASLIIIIIIISKFIDAYRRLQRRWCGIGQMVW